MAVILIVRCKVSISKRSASRLARSFYIGAAEKVVTGSFSIVYQSFLETMCTGFLEKHVKVVHLKILSFQI
jgi:F0F1-type ATP synthase assembly protein I